MKKILFGLMACAALCACTSDDLLSVSNEQGNVSGDGVATYMTVRIKNVNSGTRATSGDMAYGTTDEQTVNNAYFYFYGDDGSYMAKGSVNDPEGTASSEEPVGNIEWESETVVAVWGLAGDNLPTKMLTVLNQPSGVDLTNKDFDAAVATLAGTPYGESGNFVMSTSVYQESNAVVNYTALEESDFYPEPVNLEEDYADGGVDVYVERLAAKVGLDVDNSILWNVGNQSGQYDISVTETMFEDWAKAPEAVSGYTYVIQLQGWDVDGVARDAKLVKDIADISSDPFEGWDAASSFRCYWAESEAYGDEDVTYPAGNWKGNTADDEDTDPLNEYLRYVDLQNPVAFGSTTYCGENTNSEAVIVAANDSSMNCLTQVLVKAQFGLDNNNSGAFEGIDIVKYHGEYLTLSDFEEDMIAEVERYDFSGMIDEVAEALESTSLGTNPITSGYLHTIVNALEPVVYCKKSNDETAEYEVFDSRFMQLYSQNDGKVSIWFDTDTSKDTNGNGRWNTSDSKGYAIPDYYTGTNIVKEAAESMDDYDFYFKFDESIEDLGSTVLTILETLGFVTVNENGLGIEEYYLPLANNFTINVYNSDGTVNHSYTARNYLVRAIEREAAGINDDWEDTGYPYYYNGGLMYYNVPIEHLATGTTTYPDSEGVVEAQYGVVRNHWYNITVTSLESFGHAIADEEEVIVPQVEEDYQYLGADINILSWQMVNQEVGW